MPQELETPIASPRLSYKPGDEVTIGGQTLKVIATSEDGTPLFQASGDFKPDSPKSEALTSSPKNGGSSSLEKMWSKRDRVAALPEGPRALVIDRLFDKLVKPKIPSVMKDDQRTVIKQRFVDQMMGQKPVQVSMDPTESDFKRAGLPTGMGGKFQEGVMRGTGNVLSLADKATDLVESGIDKIFGGDKVSNKGLSGLITGKEPESFSFSKPFLESADVLHQATSAYDQRHGFKGGAGEIAGQILPSILTEKMVMPGAGKAATAVGKGAAGMIPFDPSAKGLALGALTGGVFSLGGKALSKVKNALIKPGAKAATPVAEKAMSGAAENATGKLEELSQKQFQKPLSELTPDQKIKLVNDWRDASVDAAKVEKEAAKKAAQEAKVAAVTKKATEVIDQKVAVRKAMDEAKALQKQISAFIKANKRAPNEQELLELKSKPPIVETPKTATLDEKSFKKAEEFGISKSKWDTLTEVQKDIWRRQVKEVEADAERGIKKPEKRTFLRTDQKDVKEYYDYRFQQIRSEIAGAATPEEKTLGERRLAELAEVQKLHPTSMGDVHDFKVESPEAIKAVQAVADVSKVVNEFKPPAPKVEIIPEGQHSTGGIGKRAKDAERKAAERSKGIREQLETEAQGTPETALLEKESQYLELMDKLEALGPKGKEAAKNLNQYKRKGLLTMDQVLEMSNKILTDPKYKAKAMGAE